MIKTLNSWQWPEYGSKGEQVMVNKGPLLGGGDGEGIPKNSGSYNGAQADNGLQNKGG